MDWDFKLEDYITRRRDVSTAPAIPASPPVRARHKRLPGFAILPEAWVRILPQAKSWAVYEVAIRLLIVWERREHKPVKLGNIKLNCSRAQKARALQWLADHNLILMERRPRKSPLIRPCFTD